MQKNNPNLNIDLANIFRSIENSAIGYPLEYYIAVFLGAYEYLISNYASNVCKSGWEYFTP